MSMKKLAGIVLAAAATISATSLSLRVGAQDRIAIPARYAAIPEGATHCDPSLPIFVALVPLGNVVAGRPIRFEVRAESSLDPDLIKRSWVEYDAPARVRRMENPADGREILGHSGKGRMELDFIIPDESRYELRARLVVQLVTGEVISQTAVRWVDLGDEDPPEGMLGKIAGRGGAGIRMYRGVTVRK